MIFIHFLIAWLRSSWWTLMGYKPLVPGKIAQQRGQGCLFCEHNKDGVCELCHCLIQAKVLAASEKCPAGYWPSVKIPNDKWRA